MTSRNRQRGFYVNPEDTTEAFPTDYLAAKPRQATLYDAVAGRVSHTFSKEDAASGSIKTLSGQHHLRDSVLAPEEVLFSRKRAPQRYAEKDIYFTHESLPDGGRNVLPESDMVKAIHSYASQFYEALGHRRAGEARGDIRRVDERSMDETALLAFGILLEEAAQESLGKEGDLVFTEGVEDDFEDRGKQKTPAPRGHTPVGFEGEEAFWRRPYPKRRKTKGEKE